MQFDPLTTYVQLQSGGSATALPGGVRTLALRGSAAVIVPRGIWHTEKFTSPAGCCM